MTIYQINLFKPKNENIVTNPYLNNIYCKFQSTKNVDYYAIA